MSAIELQVRGDVRGRFAETPRGAHHFAGDSVNLIRRETLVRLALATPGKKGHYQEQSGRKCDKGVRAADTLQLAKSNYRSAPNPHGILGGLFLLSLQEFEGLAEDLVFG